MDWVAFALLLQNHIALYVIILALSVIIYAVIFKRFFISILDPAIFAVLFSVFGFSVVWFLYFTDNIATRYLASYLLTQAAFWGGLFTFKSLQKKQVLAPVKTFYLEEQSTFEKVFFLVVSAVYVIVQLLSYKVIGVPLLLGSHINLYDSSGGWGILGRILQVAEPCSIFMLIYFLVNRRTSIFLTVYKYCFLVLVILFFALSGSKSEFMLLGFVLFCFLLLNASQYARWFSNINKTGAILLIVGVLFAFLTILISPGSVPDGQTGSEVFLFRLVASGDTYFFAYPNAIVEHLDSSRPLLALFGDIFSTLRIIPRDKQPVVLGVQLFRQFSDLDITAGPNARQNVFGYVYFGSFGSILFSYLIGLLLSFVRNKLFFGLRRNLLLQLVFVLLYLALSGIETDPPQAFSTIGNDLLILPVLLFISTLFFVPLMKSRIVPNLNGR